MILRIRSENVSRTRTPLNGRARSAAWSMLGLVEDTPAPSAEPFQETSLGTNGRPSRHPRDTAPLLRPAPESALASAFTLLTPGRPAWHAFSASVALHAVAILVLPIVSQRLFREDSTQRIRRERITQSLLIRIPEDFYLAAPPAPRTPPPPARAAAAPAPAPRREAAPKEAAPSAPLVARRAFSPPPQPAGRSGGAAPPQRHFELPPVLRAETDMTVLQSRQSARTMPRVQLPEMFFWAPPPPQRVLRAFVQPGGAKPQAQRPRLDAPPRLDVPGATVLPSESAPLPGAGKLNVPAPFSMPVQTARAQPEAALPAPPEIGVTGPGEPANILVLSASQAPLKEYVAVPPGNVVGRAPGIAPGGGLAGAAAGSDGGTGPASSAGSGASGKGSGAGAPGSGQASGIAGTAAGTGGGGTGPAVAGSAAGSASGTGAAGGGAGAAGNAAGSGTGAASGSGSGSGTGAGPGGQGTGGTGAGTGGSGLTPALRAAIAATRMVNPSNGVFDLVVQSSGTEGFTESAGILSGRPVYSVYMNVGGPREWILQYCIPGSEPAPAEVSGGAVMLAAPGRLLAPFPLVTYRPPPRRSHARYLMLHGFLSAEGRFERLRVLGAADPLDAAAALAALERWEFRPATEDRKPARIEVLVAIPGE